MPPEEQHTGSDPVVGGGGGVDSPPTTKEQDSDFVMRECMLDIFPLTKEELQRLLLCYTHFDTTDAKNTFSSMLQAITGEDENMERLRNVEEVFCPESASLLRQAFQDAFVIGTGYDDSDHFKFLEAMVALLGRRGTRSLLQILYRVVASANDDEIVQPEALVGLVHRLILGSHYLKTSHPEKEQQTPHAWIMSLTERAKGCSEGVTETLWMDWVNSIAPQVYQALSTFAHYAIFTPNHPFRSTSPPLSLPETDQACALWKQPYQMIPSSLTLLAPNLGGKWVRQYSSDNDGCSFAAFQQALLGYQGPTVIILQTTAGDAMGFYSDIPWKESKKWFGQEADSFLFGLKPSLQYYGPVGGKQYNMYLNNPVLQRPGDLYGLAIGGISDKTPRLHITTTFEQCKAGAMDGVYASGPLLSNEEIFFDIDVIEVWAVNVASNDDYAKSLAAGKAQTDSREGNRIKVAQVDRTQFLDDFQSVKYANSLYTHREQTRGRHSFCADDEGRGYFIDELPPTPKANHKVANEESLGETASGVFIDDRSPRTEQRYK